MTESPQHASRNSLDRIGGWSVAVSGVTLLGAAVLLGIVVRHSSGALQQEYRINTWLGDHASSGLDLLARFFNYMFSPVGSILIGALLAFWIWRRSSSITEAIRFAALAGLGWLSTGALKLIFAEPRPALLGLCPRLAHGVCDWLVVEDGTDAFPSGHTAAVVALGLAAILVMGYAVRGWIAALAVLAVLVALSRLYLGVHYLTDTLGGLLAASGTVLLLAWLWDRLGIGVWLDGRLPRSRRGSTLVEHG